MLFHFTFLLQVLGCSKKVFFNWRQGTVCVVLRFQDVCFKVELPLLYQFQTNQKFVDFKDDAIGTVWSVPSCTLDQADIWHPRTLWVEREKGICLKKKKKGASWGTLVVKDPLANAWDVRDASLIPGSGRSPGERNGNPPQCSCLENSMDREAWWATVCGVAKSPTQQHIHTQEKI